MPILLNCNCGQKSRVQDQLAGKRVLCPGCKKPLFVPLPETAPEVPVVDIQPAVPEPERRKVRRPPVEEIPVVEPADEDEPSYGVTEEPGPNRPKHGRQRRSVAEEESLAQIEKDSLKFQRRPSEDRRRTSGGFHANPSILGGLGMMVGAIIWFVVGLAVGYIFFYPPILFILGLVAFIKGLVKSGE